MATSSAKKVLMENLKQRAFKEKKIIDDATALGDKLTALDIKIASKVGSGDKLFGSVTANDLASALEAKGHAIEKNRIALPGKIIKRLGKQELPFDFIERYLFRFPLRLKLRKSLT